MMAKSEYISIQRAAQLCGVSDKTIQRAIRAGKLPAEYPQPNCCKIALSDLEVFRPGHVSGHIAESLESRVAELEERFQQFERQLCDLLSRQDAPGKRRVTLARERTTGPLPKHLVSLLTFADHHNVAQTKVQTHVDIRLLPGKHGEWTDTDGTVVTLALDSSGRAAFHQIYHELPSFIPCKQCPY